MLSKSLFGEDINPYKGFDDNTLKYVSKLEKRTWLDLPDWLYLPFYGDHGYSAFGKFQQHEIENNAHIHVTFNKYRYEALKNKVDKYLLYINNPYVPYRKINKLKQKPHCKGTLVFYTHTINNVYYYNYNFEEYLDLLLNLPESYHPIVFMFHNNDIRKGNYKHLKKRGFPVLTAGNQSDWQFIDRFYEIISHFKYGTSNSGGSELFYCTEMGLKYFILGKEPMLFNKGHKQNKRGLINNQDELLTKLNTKKRELFHFESNAIQDEKDKFITVSLGLDSEVSAADFRQLLLKEYIRTFPSYINSTMKKILNKCTD